MIAYQGSEGSYSEELLKKEFSNYSFIACESFTELLNKVSSENCLGLLPVENSIAGTVNEAYEELINSGLEIFGEYIKKIDHTLIGLSNSKFEEITHVISHPQALQQCSKFLQDSNLRITPVFDTAGSVFEILETKDINTAAIAGEHFKNDERTHTFGSSACRGRLAPAALGGREGPHGHCTVPCDCGRECQRQGQQQLYSPHGCCDEEPARHGQGVDQSRRDRQS